METIPGERWLVLVKHAQPVLNANVPPREWRLGTEGEEQSRELAERLKAFLPFTLVSSNEPKAMQTAAIVATTLGVISRVANGLEEIDRPAMPILSRDEHERLNAALFRTRSIAVVGHESADTALARFEAAIQDTLAAVDVSTNVVVIAHGTVISLFVARCTGRDALDAWRALRCADFVRVPLTRTTIDGQRTTSNGAPLAAGRGTSQN